jgi:uncharacterized protein YlxW (UPF0749 family)
MFGLLSTLSIQERLIGAAVFLIWSLGCFTGGYAYKWHLYSVADAARQATQDTAQVTAAAGAQASDTKDIDRLQAKLDESQAWATTLQKRIKDLSNAKPADLSCRVPDGLLVQLNDSLSARPGRVAAKVP